MYISDCGQMAKCIDRKVQCIIDMSSHSANTLWNIKDTGMKKKIPGHILRILRCFIAFQFVSEPGSIQPGSIHEWIK